MKTDIVTRFHKLQTRIVDGKPLCGYVLFSGRREAAFIHADRHARIDALLEGYCEQGEHNARELMRALLNAEDFSSPVYDRIFRVYYTGEFDSPVAGEHYRLRVGSAGEG